eukprot:12912231-Alexandrium_andersonii.AAC.1
MRMPASGAASGRAWLRPLAPRGGPPHGPVRPWSDPRGPWGPAGPKCGHRGRRGRRLASYPRLGPRGG